jgi:hypothetical protein
MFHRLSFHIERKFSSLYLDVYSLHPSCFRSKEFGLATWLALFTVYPSILALMYDIYNLATCSFCLCVT